MIIKVEKLDNRNEYETVSRGVANQVNHIYGGVIVTSFAEIEYYKCLHMDDVQEACNRIRATGRTVIYLVKRDFLEKL